MTRDKERLADYLTRNAVAHGYFKVDLELVWKTILRDLPGLYQQVRDLADGLQRDDESPGMKP